MSERLPEPFRECWRPAGSRNERGQFGFVSTRSVTRLYEHVPTAEAFPIPGQGIPVRSLFTVDVRTNPSLPAMGVSPRAVLGVAASHAKSEFVAFVEQEGLVVEGDRSSGRFRRADGTAGRRTVLETSYPLEGSEPIDAETHVVVWPTETAYGLAGGTLPLSAPPDVADVLAIDPEGDRDRVEAFARTVEPRSDHS